MRKSQIGVLTKGIMKYLQIYTDQNEFRVHGSLCTGPQTASAAAGERFATQCGMMMIMTLRVWCL